MKRQVYIFAWMLLLAPLGQAISAQTDLPPIFADTPKQIAAAKRVAEFPVNTFLENIAVDKRGNLFITSHEEGKIYRLTPDGAKSEFAKVAGKATGIVFDRQGNLLVTGWCEDKQSCVFLIAPNGATTTLATIDGAQFLNGITSFRNGKFLIADSYRGAIWEFDPETKKYSIWLEDAVLARSVPNHVNPAVNGLKFYNSTLYATNTQQQQLIRIPVNGKGAAGKPEVWLKNINGDDFAFDSNGNLYVTTHTYNNVVRIAPDGKTAIVAESGEGMTGSTALAFGRDKRNRQAIFVVTNGGMSLPPKNGVQPAKVVRLEVGAVGAK